MWCSFVSQCRRVSTSALLFLMFLSFSCGSGEDFPRWTIMWYGNGDNNLEHYIVSDFLEMQRTNVFGSSLTVVALIDRAPGYSIAEGDWTDTRLYEL